MLKFKILLPYFISYLGKSTYKVNNRFVEDKNKSSSIIFLTKFKILAKLKRLLKSKIIKFIKKPNFFTSNIKKVYNFLI